MPSALCPNVALCSLFGLVLAGGRSTRMGRDKGLLDYHGKPQREVIFEFLKPICADVFLSVNTEQASGVLASMPCLVDEFPEAGPLGALLTAFRFRPDVAWLVVACDLPFLSGKTISFLVENRNSMKLATALRLSNGEPPEPLVTIWEPAFLPFLQSAFQNNQRSPRRLLIAHNVEILDAPDPAELRNVNSFNEQWR
ncbi:MAG: NTP transferase domain-containing protein [Cytophagaceae bacterium]|nr:NTP transferase domain-containing protein [Cytophagaceae bacterium]